MKLNPPETAPRNSLVLGHFKGVAAMIPMIWDYEYERWIVPWLMEEACEGSSGVMRVFRNNYFRSGALTGWIPMPGVDEDGNVT